MRFLAFCLTCLTATALLGLTPEEAEQFPFAGGKIILTRTFEEQPRPTDLPEGISIRPGEGDNGTCALHVASGVQEWYKVRLDGLVVGDMYEVRFKVRSKDFVPDNPKARAVIIGIGHLKEGKIVRWDYPVFQEDHPDGFKEMLFTFQPRAEEDEHQIYFNAWSNYKGDLWFDDVEVKLAGEDIVALLCYPSNLTLRDKQREVLIKCSDNLPAGATLLFKAEQGGQVVEHFLCNVQENGKFQAFLPNLQNGKARLTVKVLDTQKKVYLYEGVFNLKVDDQTPTPPNAVTFDKLGRAFIDGKPFMPLGVFGLFTDIDLERTAAAGFNCAQIYASFSMHGNTKLPNRVDNIRNRLDKFQELGLKLLFSVNQQLPGYFEGVDEFDGAQGKVPAARRVAELFGSHPALLGYYVSDEVYRSLVPEIVKLREALADADPWHPSWTLTYRMNDLPYYGISGDVIGVDPYPINAMDDEHSKLDGILTEMAGARTTGLPIWVVPQIFNWGVYNHRKPEEFVKTRGPNQKEMIAMPILCAMEGAKGFIFYSYIAFFFHAENIVKGIGPAEWPKVVKMAKVMRSLEDFILSAEPEIPIEIQAQPEGRARARLFHTADGRYALTVVALGPDAVEATIKLPDNVPLLTSETGNTTALGNNIYRFTAPLVDYDILRN
jgi:hypothetical protein